MNAEALFQALCAQSNLGDAVAKLNEFELAALIQWLRAGHGRGVQGLVLGLAELAAADRFTHAHSPTIL
jgi:hypothetical protein